VRVISFAGCGGNKEPEPVEYDLDNEDEDWLTTYNLGRTRIGDVLFERMLWKLELECAAATEHALTAAGALGDDAACQNQVLLCSDALCICRDAVQCMRIVCMQCHGAGVCSSNRARADSGGWHFAAGMETGVAVMCLLCSAGWCTVLIACLWD
jgi:hypothetical protein